MAESRWGISPVPIFDADQRKLTQVDAIHIPLMFPHGAILVRFWCDSGVIMGQTCSHMFSHGAKRLIKAASGTVDAIHIP